MSPAKNEKEDFLNQIFGLCLILEDPDPDAPHGTRMAAEELCKGFSLSGLHLLD